MRLAATLVAGSSFAALAIAPVVAQGAAPAAPAPAATGAASVSQLAAPAVDSPTLYVLGAGDQLQLSFLDPSAKDIGGAVSILPDGTSTLALLGSVQLSGLTVGQATRWLTSLYTRYLVRPQLILTLTSLRPVKVSVLGEVARPGLYPLATVPAGMGSLTPGVATMPNPVMAIQTAGGVTLDADIRRVVLRRVIGPSGEEKQTVLNLAQLLQIGNQRQNPILFDGDTLIVPRAKEPVPSEVIEIGISNLAPEKIRVTVLGEVKTPGVLELSANTPLQQALMLAGGPSPWRANKSRIELVRLNRNGTATTQFFDYQPGQNISSGFNPPLRDRDTVIVRRSYYGKTVDLLNQVVAPMVGTFNTFYYLYNNTR